VATRRPTDVIASIVLARTTGVNFLNARAFVEERFPPEGTSQVLARLSEADRSLFSGTVRAKDWYDLEAYVRVIRAIDAVLGNGDLSLLPTLGRYEAERDRTFVQTLFLRMASPGWAVRMVMEYWRAFHDSGRWVVRSEGERMLHGVLEDFGVSDEAFCAELTGYVARVMEFAGGRNARMTHPRCRGRGDEQCYFQLSWDR